MAVVINVVGKTNMRDLAKAEQAMARLKKEADKAARGIGGSIQKAGDRLKGFGQRTADVGDKMSTRVSLPLLGAGAAALTMARDFNAGMANVATLIPGNTERVAELKGGVQDLAVEVGKSTSDLSDGLYNTISAFGDSSESMAILETNARAATAGLASTTDAINLTSAVTKGYGDTSGRAVKKAADLALLTVRLGQTTFPELAASVGKVIPLTSAMAVSQEELFGVMATFTGVTGGAAEVSTQLRGVMQGLMQPTSDMAGLLDDLGVESGKALVEQEGLQGAMAIIADAAEKSGKPLGKFLASIEAQTLVMAASGGQADAFTEKTKAMADAQGTTAVAFEEATTGVNEAGFALAQATEKARTMGQDMGDALAPAMLAVFDAAQPLIAKIQEGVDWFTSLDQAQQRQILKWVALAAAMGPAMSIFGRLLKPVGALVRVSGKAVSGIGNLGRAFGRNAEQAPKWAQRVANSSKAVGRGISKTVTGTVRGTGRAVKALGRWAAVGGRWAASTIRQGARASASMAKTAAKFAAHYAKLAAKALWSAGRMAASWVIAMGPVGWVIAAVVALVALIIANWDKVKRFTKAAWEWVSDKIAAVWRWVQERTAAAVSAVVRFVGNLRDRATAIIRAIVDFVYKYHPIMVLWRLAKEWVPKVIGFFVGLKDRAVGIVGGMVDTIRDKFDRIVSFVTGMPARISSAASGMWDGITAAFRGAINTIIRGWNRIEFRVPGFKVGPIGYDGFTLGLPDIPQLATGAVVKATRGGTLANIGEGRHDEAVVPLPSGWDRRGGALGGPSVSVTIARGAVQITAPAGTDDRTLQKMIDDGLDRLASRVVSEVLAGAGAA